MCVEHRNLTWTLVLLFLSGALCSQMTVKYQLGHICAVKGSSVDIPCSFHYPNEHKVMEVLWGHEKDNIYDGPFLYSSTWKNTTSRFQYIGDKKHNCSFIIHQVENNDTGKYAFRFITDKDKFTGVDGSMLKVVDLNVSLTKLSGSRSLKEGDSVNLTCINGCDGGHRSSIFTWLKNGEPIHEGPALYLRNISSTNTGNYTCSLKTQRATTSEVINIDVEYGPKNTSGSIIPSKEVDASSYFKLICTSNANPPVENYTWFKIVENDHLIDVGPQPVISSTDGGQYFCSATNKHGSKNSTVIVMIKEPFNRGLLLIPTVAVLLIVTTVIAITRLNKKRTRALETDCEEDIQNTAYVNWPVIDSNQSQERSQCEGTTSEVIYTTVDFHTKRKSNTEQQMDSHHDDESVIYSTVCRKQLWSPSYIETV